MNIKLMISDIVIQIEAKFEICVEGSIEKFIVQDPETDADVKICVFEVEEIDIQAQDAVYRENGVQIYQKGESIIQKFNMFRKEKEAFAILSNSNKDRNYILNADALFCEMFRNEGKIYSFLGMEGILLKYSAFYLHASFVKYKGEAILFTAASGTGKSTQASLWELYEGAKICNGDKTIIRQKNGRYFSYGSPFAGSSGIYENEKAPLKAIIVLSQSVNNRLEKLNGKSAFLSLYKETLMNTWNPEYMSKMTDLLMDVVANIPIYHLACRPDQEAVELVKNTLFQED